VTAYIEIVPTDGVKYEIDKHSGYLKVDRPQRFSVVCPTLYGFIPRTWCQDRVAALSPGAERGDGDPLDICVISERPIARSEVILTARVIGGLRMIDDNSADDKIIAVLEADMAYGHINSIHELPVAMVDRLRQYFLTYKLSPDETHPPVEITHVYDATEAMQIIRYSQQDYHEEFHGVQDDAVRFLHELAETVRPSGPVR
jgi:inorganic pyrophosphatase